MERRRMQARIFQLTSFFLFFFFSKETSMYCGIIHVPTGISRFTRYTRFVYAIAALVIMTVR